MRQYSLSLPFAKPSVGDGDLKSRKGPDLRITDYWEDDASQELELQCSLAYPKLQRFGHLLKNQTNTYRNPNN